MKILLLALMSALCSLGATSAVADVSGGKGAASVPTTLIPMPLEYFSVGKGERSAVPTGVPAVPPKQNCRFVDNSPPPTQGQYLSGVYLANCCCSQYVPGFYIPPSSGVQSRLEICD